MAPWRLRVHASRRRVILVVRSMVRLMRGKVRVAPVPKLDRFDFAIYATLGEKEDGAHWEAMGEDGQDGSASGCSGCYIYRDKVFFC